MKTQIATTQDQSSRLLRCGVPADTADMMWSRLDETRDHSLYAIPWYTPRLPNRKITDNNFPAWSLSALLGLLPKEIDIDGYPYRISIYFENHDEPVIGNQWCLYYKPKKHNEKSRIDDVPMYAPDLIECAVQMIIWLINYGYKLNGIEKGGSEHGED